LVSTATTVATGITASSMSVRPRSCQSRSCTARNRQNKLATSPQAPTWSATSTYRCTARSRDVWHSAAASDQIAMKPITAVRATAAWVACRRRQESTPTPVDTRPESTSR